MKSCECGRQFTYAVLEGEVIDVCPACDLDGDLYGAKMWVGKVDELAKSLERLAYSMNYPSRTGNEADFQIITPRRAGKQATMEAVKRFQEALKAQEWKSNGEL